VVSGSGHRPAAGEDLAVARTLAAGIGARITPIPQGAGYELVLP